MSNLVVQDILNNVNDLLSNYTTGSIDLGNRMRAVNRAIEYVKRRMTFPSDEVIQQISFTEDNLYYDLNVDFNEGLFVFYDDPAQNFPETSWNYAPYGDLLRMSGRQFLTKNYFSWTPINGKMQLILFGKNLNQGSTLNTFDSLSNPAEVGLNDADNLSIDVNIKKEGSGSLKFDIDPNIGATGKASIYFTTNFDFTTLFNSNGFFKLWVWLSSTAISSISINLYTDASNFYTLSTTTFDDSSAFSTGLDAWGRIQLGFENAVVTGSPAIGNITAMQIDFNLSGSFGSVEVESFRIDDLYTVFPDLMNFVYLTSYKGTDTTGATQKIFLTDVSDIPAFGEFVPDMLDVIAYRAAIILVPQIMSNADFRKMYIEESEEVMKVVGKSWPRKRVLNYGKLILSR